MENARRRWGVRDFWTERWRDVVFGWVRIDEDDLDRFGGDDESL
jgi:hypothetical protein